MLPQQMTVSQLDIMKYLKEINKIIFAFSGFVAASPDNLP